MDYLIGIDGGGTKTEAIAYSIDTGKELARGYSGYGNLVLNKDIALNNIISSIKECNNKIQDGNLKYICLGLAGVESGNNKLIVKKTILDTFKTKIEVLNDAQIAIKAMLKGNDGILTIAGTGSISYGIYKNKSAIASGWGHLLGDEGSGYYISIEAFKRAIFEEDSNIEKSILTKNILSKLKINNTQEIKSFIYSSSKNEIASFAPLISNLANNGEENAIKILEKAGTHLAINTERVCKKLDLFDNVNVAIKGSIITKVLIVNSTFKKYLKSKINNVKIIDTDVSSCRGAYYLYLNQNK